MRDERVETRTQTDLVAELHKRGYSDVTERQIAGWRRKELLPSFDVIGGGKGRRRGRARSSWSDGEAVLNQALWIRELLQIYGNAASIILPLWMLGYPVRYDRIREALCRPLAELADEIAEAVQDKSRASGEIEDFIEEAAYYFVDKLRRAGAGAFLMPQHSLEAIINVFLNQDYDLTDGAFALGAEELKEYDGATLQRQAAAIAGEGPSDAHLARNDDGLEYLFDRASFIKQYFSLHALKHAVDECTDDDLQAVSHDLYLLREIALLARKIITIIVRNMPAEQQPPRADILRPIFTVGAALVLADLSLRRNGFAETIDHFLSRALLAFQQGFTEKVESDLVEASKILPDAIETFEATVFNCFNQESNVGGPEQAGLSP